MTYREFKTLVSHVAQERFRSEQNHPLLFGIERLQFEKLKLKRLVEAGSMVDCKTARRRVQAWEREIARLEEKGRYMTEQYHKAH